MQATTIELFLIVHQLVVMNCSAGTRCKVGLGPWDYGSRTMILEKCYECQDAKTHRGIRLWSACATLVSLMRGVSQRGRAEILSISLGSGNHRPCSNLSLSLPLS